MEKTVFVRSLPLILALSNVIGMGHFCHRVDADEQLVTKSNSGALVFLELLRTALFFSATYTTLRLPAFYLRYLQLIRFGAGIVLAQLLENRMVKLANGIIGFDRELLSALPVPVVCRQFSAAFWSAATGVFAFYYVVLHKCAFDLLAVKTDVFSHVVEFVFVPPRAMDFVIAVTACFYLTHLGCRFRALNAAWRTLLGADLEDPGPANRRRTASETAALAETLRLLHADLSDMLRLFNLGYGPIVLDYLVFSAVDLLIELYYLMVFKQLLLGVVPCFHYLQNMLFVFGVLFAASWTNTEKKDFIRNLRSCQIKNLHYKVNTQIKLFMAQINVYENTETLACGIINYRLSLIIPIMVLMITIASTLFQLKNQTFFIQFLNSTMDNGPWSE